MTTPRDCHTGGPRRGNERRDTGHDLDEIEDMSPQTPLHIPDDEGCMGGGDDLIQAQRDRRLTHRSGFELRLDLPDAVAKLADARDSRDDLVTVDEPTRWLARGAHSRRGAGEDYVPWK
jgi:hypothetical protein